MTQFKLSPPDSARLHQIPPNSAGVCQSLLDSAGLWWTTVCDRMSHYVTNLLLFVTYTGVRWSLVDSMESARVRQSRWGSVKY